MEMSPIRIDLWKLVRQKFGPRGRYLPHFLVKPLEALIRQDDMNDLLRKLHPRRGAEFCREVLRLLDIRLTVEGEENLPADPRAIFVCNHPLGGIDGIALIAWLSGHYGRECLAIVNDLLMAVEPLRGNFLPVNKFGRQGRDAVGAIDSALAGDSPILCFPAGLVSRLGKNSEIRDLEWRKSVVVQAVASGRPIVPLYFDGLNSGRFYKAALWRKRLDIKFNLEQALLPREVFRSRGASFRIVCGRPVAASEFQGGRHAAAEAARLRETVYALAAAPASNSQVAPCK